MEEPLAEDETFDIRYSTMVVGIRGTCGWVEVRDEEHMLVYILEGTVEGRVTALEGDKDRACNGWREGGAFCLGRPGGNPRGEI